MSRRQIAIKGAIITSSPNESKNNTEEGLDKMDLLSDLKMYTAKRKVLLTRLKLTQVELERTNAGEVNRINKLHEKLEKLTHEWYRTAKKINDILKRLKDIDVW